MKKNPCTPINPKKYSCYGLKKIPAAQKFPTLMVVPKCHVFLKIISALRLVGGSRSSEGRVEVFYDNQWGTVCDDYWDINDARVVCHQLGYPGAISAPTSARFGAGSGRIWLDDVNCQGDETSIVYCGHRGWGINNCGHYEDASVVCYGLGSGGKSVHAF